MDWHNLYNLFVAKLLTLLQYRYTTHAVFFR